MRIVSTHTLGVQQLGKNEYLTWVSVWSIPFVPKVIYELDERRNVLKVSVVGFMKALIFNYLLFLIIIIVFFYIRKMTFFEIINFTPFFICVLVFLFVINFVIIDTTKRTVNKQIG